jgi:sialidase-1
VNYCRRQIHAENPPEHAFFFSTMKFTLFTFLLAGSLALSAEPLLEKQDLFKTGDDPAYNIYHIPGVVVTAKGTVLAWCEARKGRR